VVQSATVLAHELTGVGDDVSACWVRNRSGLKALLKIDVGNPMCEPRRIRGGQVAEAKHREPLLREAQNFGAVPEKSAVMLDDW
jgi:hypothetical protein